MKNKTIILVLFIIISTQLVNAQKQFNTWYFGNKASLDFNVSVGDLPTSDFGVINPNNFAANSSVWCNSDGDISFYSDGSAVYNSSGSADISGLTGTSVSQPVLIVPRPAYPNNFYIITAPQPSALGSEVKYKEIIYDDAMGYTSSAGVDGILTVQGAGKIASIANEDKSIYWVVSHQLLSDNFEIHGFDEFGHSYSNTVSLEPEYGDHITESNIFGFMKFSPKGNYLAVSSDNTIGGRVDIYDFDKENGTLDLNNTYSITAAYGIEFSPEEDFLYVGQNELADSRLYQIDIVGETVVEVGVMEDINRRIGALQLGPDGRIYVAHQKAVADNDFLGVINQPNMPGASCVFDKEAIQIGNSNNAVTLSLPSTPANLVLPKEPFDFIVISGGCAGAPTTFKITGDMTNVTSVEWQFDDINNDPNDYSTDTDPSYTFWNGGIHHVELVIWENSTPIFIQHDIDINGPEILSLLGDQEINCGEVLLSADFIGDFPYIYTWTNTTTLEEGTEQDFNVSNAGDNEIFFSITDNSGCTASYTETVIIEELPTLTFDLDNFVACDQTTLSPTYTSNGTPMILWSLDGNSPVMSETFTITTTGVQTLVVEISDLECYNSYTETITINESPIVDLGPDRAECANLTLSASIGASSPIATTEWFLDGSLVEDQPNYTINEPAGTYSVTHVVIDDNGCEGSNSLNITLLELPTLTFNPENFEACDQTTLSPVYTSGGTPIFEWETLPATISSYTETFTINLLGTYSIVVTITDSGNFCSNTYTETVTINQSPILDDMNKISGCDEIILDANDLEISGNTIISYDWLNQNTLEVGTEQTFIVSNPISDIVELTVIDEHNCSATGNFEVMVNESPTLTFSQSFEACDYITLIPSYTSVEPPTFYWENMIYGTQGYTETFTVTEPGASAIEVTITDPLSNCSNLYTETVTVNQSPELNMGEDLISCDTITLNGYNMIITATNPTFSWENQSIVGTETGNNFFIDNIGENIIELTVTDENNCFTTDYLNVFLNASPTIDLGEDIECATVPIELNIPNDEYQFIYWSIPFFDNTYSCTAIESGEYWVEVIDQNNCVAKDTVIVTYAECQNFFLETTINSVNPDNYYLNCEGNKNISLTANPDFFNNNICYSQDVATTQFFWDMGDGTLLNDQNPSYTYQDLGTYVIHLVAVDDQNCKSNRSFVVEFSNNPFVSATDKIACMGETIDIVAGREGEGNDLDIVVDFFDVTYPRQDTYSTTILIPDNENSYETTISIYDKNNYIIQDPRDIFNIYVEMEHSNIKDFNDFKIICPTGEEVTLMNTTLADKQIIAGEPVLLDDATPQLGNQYIYNWSENSNLTVSDLITEGVPIKFYTDPNDNDFGYVGYLPSRTYKPADPFDGFIGCPINGDWKLVINDAEPQENGFVVEWGVIFSSGNLFTELNIDEGSWTGENIINNPNDSTITIEALNSGNSIYTLSLVDSYGCSNSQDVILSTENINLELGNDTTICFNENIELNADGGNVGNIYYQWNDGQTTSAINVTQAGEYSVEVIGEACYKSDNIIISIAPEIIANLGDDLSLCFNKSLELSPSTIADDFTYKWSTNETTQTITISEGGEYWVEVRQENCKNSDTIYINAIPELKAYLGNDTTICEGEELKISPETVENVLFNWNTSEQTEAITVTEEGEYWVEISQESCTQIDTIKINVAPALNLELGEDITIITGQQITLDTEIEDAIYLWKPTEETTQLINVSQAGKYVVTVTKGCTASDSITVYVNDVQLIIPNTFTPNGDGKNDTWLFGNADNLGEIEINIFDRLGNIMTNYTTTENPSGWDGTRNNNPLPSDTYWYIIKFKDGTTQSGTVTIRR